MTGGPSETMRLIHRAILELGVQPGTRIPTLVWKRALRVSTGRTSPITIRTYTQLGTDLGLFQQDESGVTVLDPDRIPSAQAGPAPAIAHA